MARVYVSSTYVDLKEHRERVERVLRQLGHEDVAMEYYTAEDKRPVDKCLADVASCDAYVGLLGFRYGWIPKRHNPKHLSITELEYCCALKHNLKCFMFVADSTAPWPPAFIDADRRQIDGLRSKAGEEHGAVPFTSPDNLGGQVATALANWRTITDAARSAATSSFDPAAYYEALTKRYQRLDLDALTPPQKEEYLQLQLRSIFVEQSVRANPPPVELPKEVWNRLEAEGSIPPEDIPKGVTLEEIERARGEYNQTPPRPVFEVLTDESNPHVVILGDPGSGKSTLLRYVLLSLVSPSSVTSALDRLTGALPLLFELRSYASLCSAGKCETFLEFLEYLGKTEGWQLGEGALEQFLADGGRAVALFDGLDEIFDPDEREHIMRQIVGFANYSGVRTVVTSRIIGYRRKIFTDAGFAHFTLQDLERHQVETFLERWYDLAASENPEEARQRRERIVRSFDEFPSIRQLATNPMLLTIMAIIGKHQELPSERWKLYDHAASVLIQHWDVNKHLQDLNVDADFIGEDDKKELLRRLAYDMQAGAAGLAGNYIEGERLQREFESYLEERYGQAPDRAKVVATAMIKQLRERNFILSLYGANIYGFVHRAFLEYFCAASFTTKFEKTRELGIDELKRDVYAAHWQDQSWQEVLRLICGMMDERFGAEIVAYVVDETYGPWPAEFGERLPRNIALAIGCLSEFRNLKVLGELGLHVLRTSLKLFERVLNEREGSLARFLDAELTPAGKLVGTRWPHREILGEWFSTVVRPTLRTLNGYPGNHGFGVFVGSVGSGLPEVAESLRELTKHEDGGVQCLVVHALSEYERGRPENLELLKWFEKSAKYEVARSFALRYLAENWLGANGIKQLILERARQESQESVKDVALELAMRHFGDDSEVQSLVFEAARSGSSAALRLLVEFFPDASETIRVAKEQARGGKGLAISLLAAYFHEDPQTLAIIKEAARSAPTWADEAVRALGQYFWDDPETFSLLTEIARQPGWGPKVAVEELALHFEHDPRLLPVLLELATAENSYVCGEALNTLARLFPEEPRTRPLLEAALREGEVRDKALSALVRWVYTEEQSRILLDRVARHDPSEGVRREALSILIDRFRDDATLKLLRHSAVNDDSPAAESQDYGFGFDFYPRPIALQAIVDYWPEDPGTIPLLEDRAANDPTEWIRNRASASLAALTRGT